MPDDPSVDQAGPVLRAGEDALSTFVGFVVALGSLLAWPGRSFVDQDLVLLAGILVGAATAWSFEWVVWKRPPQFSRTYRPTRFQVPIVAGSFLAMFTYFSLRDRGVADRGLISFVVSMVLIGAPIVVADYRWAVSKARADGGSARDSASEA